MDMGKHPLIFQLVIKIDKETFIFIYFITVYKMMVKKYF